MQHESWYMFAFQSTRGPTYIYTVNLSEYRYVESRRMQKGKDFRM